MAEVMESGRGRSRRRMMAEINVVPYIDVMLVLLVIFMITAPLLTPGVDVELPEAAAKVLKASESETLIISVDADGRYYLNQGKNSDSPVDLEEIINHVAEALQKKEDTPVLVRGDRKVDYGAVVRVMALLQSTGAKKIGLITKDPLP